VRSCRAGSRTAKRSRSPRPSSASPSTARWPRRDAVYAVAAPQAGRHGRAVCYCALRTGWAAVPGLCVHPVADLGDECVRGAFRQAVDRQGIDAAAAFDADGVPDQPALMGDFGEVGHRQMLVLARPWREPGLHLDQRDAEPVRRKVARKHEFGEAQLAHRPQPAGASVDGRVGRGRGLAHAG
jgi:hypothetical protein